MSGVHRSLTLLRDGQEIEPPRDLLEVSPEAACRHLPGVPYSLATNVAHAANWQQLWLNKLGYGDRLAENVDEWNWPAIDPSEWPAICRRLLEGLEQSIEIAAGEVDDKTEFILNQILIHDTYHVGQCVLLARLLE